MSVRCSVKYPVVTPTCLLQKRKEYEFLARPMRIEWLESENLGHNWLIQVYPETADKNVMCGRLAGNVS